MCSSVCSFTRSLYASLHGTALVWPSMHDIDPNQREWPNERGVVQQEKSPRQVQLHHQLTSPHSHYLAGAILLLEEPTYAARAAHAQSCPYCRLRFIFVSVSNHFLGTVYLDMRH